MHTITLCNAVNKLSDKLNLNPVEKSLLLRTLDMLQSKQTEIFTTITRPNDSYNYLASYFGLLQGFDIAESFSVMFLNNQNQVINTEQLFHGTNDCASVYPRIVVQKALQCNAAAIILAHNHPSGVSDPSTADIKITKRIVEACNLVDIRVLDHIIVSPISMTSLAEQGLM